jgi:hypothetical protein
MPAGAGWALGASDGRRHRDGGARGVGAGGVTRGQEHSGGRRPRSPVVPAVADVFGHTVDEGER